MYLLRFAIGIFESQSPIRCASVRFGEIDVSIDEAKMANAKGKTFLISAKAHLGVYPEKDTNARILIPPTQREQCEFAIQSICDLLSAFYGCARSILSPVPCVALEFVSADERDYLENSSGILGTRQGECGARTPIPMEPGVLASVSDRLAGIALLAEAYSGGESGQYRDFVRFFELAFRLPFTQLRKRLLRFLEPTPFGYTKPEIESWIELRHPLSHADMKKTQTIAVTHDVRRHIRRMEQVALDVLFNKASWHDPSTERRNIWMPDAYTASESGHMVLRAYPENRTCADI
jgi:hypothetical protein